MKTNALKKGFLTAALIFTASIWSNSAGAQNVLSDESDNGWQSTLYLYLWATSLNGTAAIGGSEVEVDEDFSDLVDNLAGAFSAHFESSKGRWGYFLDGMYVNLDPSESTPIGTINTDIEQLIFEAGGVYHFSRVIKGLFGARYQDMQLDLDLPTIDTISGSRDWIDGFIGVRLVPVQTEKWGLWLRGDVGVVGDSDTTWNIVVGGGYRFSPRWSMLAVYRVLSNDITEDGFEWDVDQSGLGLALGYTF